MMPARTPPHDLTAECALLGCILLDKCPAELIDQISPPLRPEDFYDPRHALVFQAMLQHCEAQKPVDVVALANSLKPKFGDRAYDLLQEFAESVPHAYHAPTYAATIVGHSRHRRLIFDLNDSLNDAYFTQDVDESASRAEGKMHSILEGMIGAQAVPVSETARAFLDRLGKGPEPGLRTGLADLDSLIGGFKPGQLILVGARPRIGKTAFASIVALNVAAAGSPVLFIALEQSRDELTERLICSLARIPMPDLKEGRLTEAQRDSVIEAAHRFAQMPISIFDNAPVNVSQIASLARIDRRRRKTGLLIVDYLQLVAPADPKAIREQQVAEIVRAHKMLARRLELPVILCAQLNRALEARVGGKEPMLHDIRESGSGEQDSDIVLLVHRPHEYDESLDPSEALLKVAKHRNGPEGRVALNWHGSSMTFRNATHAGARDFPI